MPIVSMHYPFAAIVGQDDLRHALMLCAIDPSLGGVLAFGDRGTGKTTAIRGLASLLPPISSRDCAYRCDGENLCDECEKSESVETSEQVVPVVDLPLGTTEDRLLGALDIERALLDGVKRFQPGLLAQANRGFLYIDEVNLLEDHLVDALLDVSASGWNVIEREGLSVRHPARFVLVGSGNPEEGDLRPQLLDRFGLSVDVSTPAEIAQRVEIIQRRMAFEQDPKGFVKRWQRETSKLTNRIVKAQELLDEVAVDDAILAFIAEICVNLGTDGLRGELTLIKAAKAHAAWCHDRKVGEAHVRKLAPFALGHRLRRDPLDDARGTIRVERILNEVCADRSAA